MKRKDFIFLRLKQKVILLFHKVIPNFTTIEILRQNDAEKNDIFPHLSF